MVFLRAGLLAFWTAYAYSMGQESASGLNAFGRFVAMSFFIVAPALYLLPIYEGWTRKHHNLMAIALVNILLGWTFIGWVAALIWACSRSKEVAAPSENRPAWDSHAVATPMEPVNTPVADATKECPFCAETIKAAAKICRYCQRDQPA